MRERLVSLLVAEARDPLGALRWTLAEMRRALADPLALCWLRMPAPAQPGWPTGYVWAHAHCLDALAGVLGDGEPDEALPVVERLQRIAAYADMRELVVRAALHAARLGDPSGAGTARMLGEAIDNPRLQRERMAAA